MLQFLAVANQSMVRLPGSQVYMQYKTRHCQLVMSPSFAYLPSLSFRMHACSVSLIFLMLRDTKLLSAPLSQSRVAVLLILNKLLDLNPMDPVALMQVRCGNRSILSGLAQMQVAHRPRCLIP